MWRIFSQLLHIVALGKEPDGGFAFEHLAQTAVIMQNFIAKEPQTFINNVPLNEHTPQITYMGLSLKFLDLVLMTNANPSDGRIFCFTEFDAIHGLKVIITMLENVDCTAHLGTIIKMLL
jgi:hypothetical protein